MKLFEKIKNKRTDCTHLVKQNEDGSYDVTKLIILGQVLGASSILIGDAMGKLIANIVSNKIKK